MCNNNIQIGRLGRVDENGPGEAMIKASREAGVDRMKTDEKHTKGNV